VKALTPNFIFCLFAHLDVLLSSSQG
jgi:hypothetical protein